MSECKECKKEIVLDIGHSDNMVCLSFWAGFACKCQLKSKQYSECICKVEVIEK